jgi:hypothetical protein
MAPTTSNIGCCLVVIIIFVIYFNLKFIPETSIVGQHETRDALASIPRLQQYCSAKTPVASDGHFVDKSSDVKWNLRFVAINIRHGDRSAIHSMPGSIVNTKEVYSTYIEKEALGFRSKLSSFKILFLPDSAKRKASEIPESEPLTHVLDPSHVFVIKDLALAPGQLTTRGFMQHIRLGKALHNAYSDLLSSITSPEQIYVRSTNYVRTIQSVAGLLTTLLPQLVDSASKSNAQIPISVYPNENDEVMHGVGLHYSSHSMKGGSRKDEKEAVIEGFCPTAGR